MKRCAALVMVVTALTALPSSARAGECVGGDADYVAQLEQVARGGPFDQVGDIYCLGLGRFRYGTNRWAGPIAARYFAGLRRSPLRGRVAKACSKILRRGKYWPAKQCVRLMAAYGLKKVGSLDTIELQSKYFPFGLRPIELAALGDPRATPQLVKRFGAEKECFEQPGTDGARKRSCTDFSKRERNRWQRKEYREAKIAVLNAMWHLADPQSRSFLETVARDDPDELVRQRAAKALQRLTRPAAGGR